MTAPTSNTNLRITELDFDDIKSNLKTYLRNQQEFQDYDFEGSAMNILLDVLAYNTHYMGYYVNMVANEMFLDTAQIRNSVLSHAKLLGYTPRSQTGAIASISVTVTPPAGNSQSTLTLPKNTPFISEAIDGVNYTFVAVQGYSAAKNAGGSFVYDEVEIKEGEPVTWTFLKDQNNNTTGRFELPSGTLDTSTITVTVQASTSNASQQVYTLNSDLTELGANSTVYFIEETDNEKYTIYFGDGVFGKALSNGNIVYVSYLDTNGADANKANVFTSTSAIGGFSNVSVSTLSKSSGGSPKESIDDIKYRAPIYYTTQNRAVTKNDYSVLLKRDYPNIESISVWGGEEYDPPQYGKVFISMKPVTGYTLSESTKEAIINDIIRTRSVLTVTPEIIDPDYMYLHLDVDVYYDPNKTNLSPESLKALVRARILQYRDENLNSFNSIFRGSRLGSVIDSVDPSIMSNELIVYVQKRVTIINGVQQNYSVKFEGPLHRGGLQEHMISYPTVQVRDSSDIQRDAYFEEVLNSATGLDGVTVSQPGTGYSDNPTVTINGDGQGAVASATVVNGRISSIQVTARGINYTVASVEISDSTGSGAVATAVLEGRNGTIRSFYLQSNGQKVIINENAGTIDYDSGEVVLTALTAFSVSASPYFGLDQNVFVIQIKPDEETLFPRKNRIITLDESDITALEIKLEVDNGSNNPNAFRGKDVG